MVGGPPPYRRVSHTFLDLYLCRKWNDSRCSRVFSQRCLGRQWFQSWLFSSLVTHPRLSWISWAFQPIHPITRSVVMSLWCLTPLGIKETEQY